MSKHMSVATLLDTKSLKEASFGNILLVTCSKAIAFTKVSETEKLKDLSVTADMELYKKIEKIFSQSPRVDAVYVYGTAGTEAVKIKSDLDEMYSKNKNYHFVLIDTYDEIKTKAVVEWADAKNKIPVYCTEKETEVSAAIAFHTKLNNRAIAFATKTDDDYPDAKMLGMMCWQTPGKDKWEWKEPSGAVVSGFSLTEIDELEEAGINTIQEEREGVLALFPGKCANGEFIDIVWGNDNMQYDIETAFIRAEKSPYKIYHPGVDDRGVVQIEAIIQEIIRDYASDFREFIAQDENKQPLAVINVKTNYTQQDIAARKFEVSWTAIPSGSASFGTIRGLLTFNKDKVKEA
ncbi:MAG: DUF3383 family protein [Cetobacterium sp.]|uniref:hypothetical protein n=1 Tax=Cetobacterium sp. TaxID=2071632 RepID=UPI002FC9A49F